MVAILALIFTIGITAPFAAAGDERSVRCVPPTRLRWRAPVVCSMTRSGAVQPGFLTPADIPLLGGGSVCRPAGWTPSGWLGPTTPR